MELDVLSFVPGAVCFHFHSSTSLAQPECYLNSGDGDVDQRGDELVQEHLLSCYSRPIL